MNLAQQLERFEGRVPHAYRDHLGFLTIGVGRLIDERKGGRLTDFEIDFLLQNDMAEKTAQVVEALPWAVRLNPPRMAVLVGMAFQMGTAGLLGFRNTLAAVRDGHYAHAAENMRQSKWAKQTPDRAGRLAVQMQLGEWQ
jgi:lysozyme